MRSVITALTIFILLIILIISSCAYVKASVTEITDKITSVEDIINEKGCAYANKDAKELKELIDRKSKWFEAIYEHMETDQLKTHCKAAQSYIKTDTKADALAELAVLKMLAFHLPEKDVLSLNNFF